MRLQAPYSGGFVEAEGEQAKRLITSGYKKAEPKKPTRKRTVKKEQ